jgi:hypothetical protein
MGMKAEKQLSIRNTEAAELAEELSRATGRAQKQVVLDGLRLLKAAEEASAKIEAAKRAASKARFDEALKRAHEEVARIEAETGRKLTSNHDDLYDEFGLPR